MHAPTIIVGLTAALASAAAIPDVNPFTVSMDTSTGYHPLHLVQNGTEWVLEASTSGSPAYFTNNAGGNYQSLHMVDNGVTYGIIAPVIGDAYGQAASVYAVEDSHQKAWTVYHGEIGHKLYAALNQLYYCNDHANGKPGVFLKFGTPNLPNPPKNCEPTTLKKVVG